MWKKLGITAVLVLLISVVVTFAGRNAIVSSPVFAEAQRAVRARFGAAGGALEVRLFAPFQFSEGVRSGIADFTLVRDDRCYPIKARMNDGRWTVTALKELKC